jgi:NAD(P)-dependent dehydrogenase (short-subunit alcohol dehydrogenase family)
LGARNPSRGEEAVQAVKDYSGDKNGAHFCELVVMDVSDDKSVQAAATKMQEQGVRFDAIVNNAGRGFSHNASPEEVLNVNLMGTKRIVDNFLPLLEKGNGRIVNVGSGGWSWLRQ